MAKITQSDIARFVADRNAALLSLDEQKILDYGVKYGVKWPSTPDAFWDGVHLARVNLLTLPDDARAYSRAWLLHHGWEDDTDRSPSYRLKRSG